MIPRTVRRRAVEPGKGFSDSVSVVGPAEVIYVSGHLGFGPDGESVVAGGVGTESEAIFEGIRQTLEAAGSCLADVVRLSAYLVDLDSYHEYANVRRRLFGDHPPASTAVGVPALLAGALIEVDAIAVRPQVRPAD